MPTSKYRAPMAGYEDEGFVFGEKGAAKFERIIHHLEKYLATTSIEGIAAYPALLKVKAMEDPTWEEPERPTKTKRVAKATMDAEGNNTTTMEDVTVDEADYKVNLNLYVHEVTQLRLDEQAHKECGAKAYAILLQHCALAEEERRP